MRYGSFCTLRSTVLLFATEYCAPLFVVTVRKEVAGVVVLHIVTIKVHHHDETRMDVTDGKSMRYPRISLGRRAARLYTVSI